VISLAAPLVRQRLDRSSPASMPRHPPSLPAARCPRVVWIERSEADRTVTGLMPKGAIGPHGPAFALGCA